LAKTACLVRHSTFDIRHLLVILPVPMTLLINILLGLYVVVALLMMLVILMQRPKSEGLGAAFGGGVTENIFGAQTTNVLTKITGWLAAIFFFLTFILSILYARKANTPSSLTRELTQGQTPAPVASATPVPGASVSPAPAANATVTPAAAGTAMPTANPGPSSAVGPPGTVTNMTPASTGPAPSVRPSDEAVGAVPVTAPPPATSPAASAAPSVSASPKQ
jgi:preprotein translocase subunit SecG